MQFTAHFTAHFTEDKQLNNKTLNLFTAQLHTKRQTFLKKKSRKNTKKNETKNNLFYAVIYSRNNIIIYVSKYNSILNLFIIKKYSVHFLYNILKMNKNVVYLRKI